MSKINRDEVKSIAKRPCRSGKVIALRRLAMSSITPLPWFRQGHRSRISEKFVLHCYAAELRDNLFALRRYRKNEFRIARRLGEDHVARNSAAKITRRSFGGMCMGAAAFGSTGLESISQAGGSQAVNNLTRATTVDRNPIRRRGTGLRGLDEGGPEAPSAR